MRLIFILISLLVPVSLMAQNADPANMRLRKLISYPATLSYSTESVLVAVVDTGVSLPAPWKNQVLPGANILRPRESTADTQGHGTAVAGIILELAPNARILPVAVAADGISTTESLIDGIAYAINQGAQIISVSIEAPIEILNKVALIVGTERIKEPLFVFAAGNSGSQYRLSNKVPDNLLIVGATELDSSRIATYSVWGSGVQIAAPAGDVDDGIWTYRAFPENEHRTFNGTSAATPVVSAAAALLKAQQPELSAFELKKALLKTSCSMPTLKTLIENGHLLNVGRLLKQSSSCPR
jgi:subtilisin family serine protease